MYALEKAVQEKPVKITSVYVGEENYWDDKTKSDHFKITLEYQGRKMENIDYWMGIGNRIIPKDLPFLGNDLIQSEKNIIYSHRGKQVPQLFNSTNFLKRKIQEIAKPRSPKVEEVLYSLLMDSTALDLTFEEFCAEFGYDTDSRKAEKIYNECNEQGKKLKRLLGEDYQYFMDNNEY